MLRLFLIVTLLAGLLSACGGSQRPTTDAAEGTDQAHAQTLSDIMQGLENEMAMVAHGIWIGDNTVIAEAAIRIADHPKVPPVQLAKIKQELEDELGAFVQYDQKVHAAAVELSEAARTAADMSSLFEIYQNIGSICNACHESYQQRISNVLSGDGQGNMSTESN